MAIGIHGESIIVGFSGNRHPWGGGVSRLESDTRDFERTQQHIEIAYHVLIQTKSVPSVYMSQLMVRH